MPSIPKTTYLRDQLQYGPISLSKSCMLAKHNPEGSKQLPRSVSEILQTLNVKSEQEYCREEKNSIFLKELMVTHVKIQSVGYVAWVHAADRHIRATDLFDPTATVAQNLGKRYFYDASFHHSQKTDTEALKCMKQEKRAFHARMCKVFQEHAHQKEEIDSEEEGSLSDRCWRLLQENWESLLKYLARVVFGLYEESQGNLEEN